MDPILGLATAIAVGVAVKVTKTLSAVLSSDKSGSVANFINEG
jgi:hypothetical protein